jgi:hypothetical protein
MSTPHLTPAVWDLSSQEGENQPDLSSTNGEPAATDPRAALLASLPKDQSTLEQMCVELLLRAGQAAPPAPQTAPQEPRRIDPPPQDGELHRERVDDTLLIYRAYEYTDKQGATHAMIGAFTARDDGKVARFPIYGKTAKVLDPVYLAAVDGVHRLHRDAASEE